MFLLAGFVGCYYDNEEELYPPDSGPVTDVSYAQQVVPILQNNCFVCHSKTAALGNVVLEGYNATLFYVNNGELLGSIKHEQGFVAMPNGAAKLSAHLIQTIQVWIEEGAKDN